MRFSTLVSSAFIGAAAAVPLSTSNAKRASSTGAIDGLPNPSPAQIKAIERLAGGSLPGGTLAKTLTPGATVTFQLITLNEIFEVSYFNNLLTRIQNNSPGFTFQDSKSRQYAIDTFTAIRAQEEIHYIGANAILSTAGQTTVQPCNFAFPPTSYEHAVALANTFTDVVLSVLPIAQLGFAQDGGDETPYVKIVGSIIAQEGEQNGWFRSQQGKVPSPSPFLTGSGPTFAFSFLKSVIVGDCPAVDLISKSVPTYPPLTVTSSNLQESDESVSFSVKGKVDSSANSIVYLTGQNNPITSPIENVRYDSHSGTSTFSAKLRFATDGYSRGLTVAALVKGTGSFADANAVASATMFGPGIIEID